MICLVKEPEGAGPPYERCCFCWRHTTWWHAKKDVAVCPECATTHKTAQIPKKADWCKQTAGLDNGAPPMTTTNSAPAREAVTFDKWFDSLDANVIESMSRRAVACTAWHDARRASLASDASPRGEAVYRITKRGAFVETEPLRAAFDMSDGSHDLYAHPAPATVESEALRALYEWYDRDGSVGGASEVFEQHRAALAPATEGRKG